MADQQSADALHLIARTKRIPQIVPYEVEARHSQRDREAGCGQRPSEGKAVIGRRAVHAQLWHIRASKRGVGTALRPPEDERLRNRVSDTTANRRGAAVLENSPITWRDERPLHFGSGREAVSNSTAVQDRIVTFAAKDRLHYQKKTALIAQRGFSISLARSVYFVVTALESFSASQAFPLCCTGIRVCL